MSAVAWRSQMSYARYSQLCAEVLRECSKEPYHSKAKAREAVYFKTVNVDNGKETDTVTTEVGTVKKS